MKDRGITLELFYRGGQAIFVLALFLDKIGVLDRMKDINR